MLFLPYLCKKIRAINFIRMALFMFFLFLSKSLQIDLQPSIYNNMLQVYALFL